MNRENRVVRLQCEYERVRTTVRTIAKKAVRNRGSACAAAISCSTAGPLRAVFLTAHLGAYRTITFTRGRKWYDYLVNPSHGRYSQSRGRCRSFDRVRDGHRQVAHDEPPRGPHVLYTPTSGHSLGQTSPALTFTFSEISVLASSRHRFHHSVHRAEEVFARVSNQVFHTVEAVDRPRNAWSLAESHTIDDQKDRGGYGVPGGTHRLTLIVRSTSLHGGGLKHTSGLCLT
jgi:hypothetical protein